MQLLRFLAILFTFSASVILPIALILYTIKAYKSKIRFALFGALGFVVMQLCIRIPLLQLPYVQAIFVGLPPILSAMLLAFTAALFETTGRYLVFKLFCKNEHSFATGLMCGIGHGGIEAITLVGLAYINNIIISTIILFAPQGLLAQSLGITKAVEDAFNSINPVIFACAGIERISTIAFHAFLSVLLFYFMGKRKTAIGFVAIIMMHTALDFCVPILKMFVSAEVQTLISTAILVVVCILSIFGIFYLQKKFSSEITTEKEGTLIE